MSKTGSCSFVDFFRLHHDADFAAGLNSIGTLNALVGACDFLELLETFDVGIKRLLARARTCCGNGVGCLDDDVKHAVRLDIVMVGLDSVNDFRGFSETTSEVGTDYRMAAIDFTVDCLADVVQ